MQSEGTLAKTIPLGAVDDWIEIGQLGKLTQLVKKYVKHLSQDSYVAL